MTIGFHFLCGDSRLPHLSEKLNRYYNEHMTELGDNVEPSYRKIGLIRKKGDGVSLPIFQTQLDANAYSTYLDKILNGMAELLKDKRKSIEELSILSELEMHSELDQKTIENLTLKNELNNIKNSKSWKLAKKLSKIKNQLRSGS